SDLRDCRLWHCRRPVRDRSGDHRGGENVTAGNPEATVGEITLSACKMNHKDHNAHKGSHFLCVLRELCGFRSCRVGDFTDPDGLRDEGPAIGWFPAATG